MSMKIVVFGALSPAGIGIIRTLTSQPDRYSVLAVVQCSSSDPRCSAILSSGATLIRGDLNDINVVSSIVAGAGAVFLKIPVPLDQSDSTERAVSIGRNVMVACKFAHVEHIIYSTAQSPLKTLGIPAKHFDAWAQVETLLRQSGLNVTYLMIPVTYEAILGTLRPTKFANGRYAVEIPTGQVPVDFMGAYDVGPVVREILDKPDRYLHKTVALSAGKITAGEISQVMTKVLSPLAFVDSKISYDAYRLRNTPGCRDLGNTFEFLIRVDQQYNTETTLKLNPHAVTFEEWLRNNKNEVLDVLEK